MSMERVDGMMKKKGDGCSVTFENFLKRFDEEGRFCRTPRKMGVAWQSLQGEIAPY